MQTIREYLTEQFGPEVDEIDGVNHPSIGGSTFKSVRLVLVGNRGCLQVKCGGDCIMAFKDSHPASRCTYYLVHDDSEGQMWDAQARQGVPPQDRKPTYYRPHARLRLVASA